MAFTGFNFRTSSSPSGFPGDGAGETAVLNATNYSAGQGYGWTGGTPSGGDDTTATDRRLFGHADANSDYILARIDVANGTYAIRLGLAAGSGSKNGARVTWGPGATDYTDITTGDNSTPDGSVMDATGASLTQANWASSQGTASITVTQGYVTIGKVPDRPLALRHFAYQVVPGPLAALTLDADDTGQRILTTGTTTVGSASVTGIGSTAGIVPLDLVKGSSIPAGTTVLAVTSATALNLSSGTGVTAASGASLTFYQAPQLYEKSPAGKLICPVTIPKGQANISVFASDGTTPNPYITTRTIGSTVWLAYTATPFPGTASSYSFVLKQTDNSGVYNNSPLATSFTLPVTFAPTKPVDGSLLAKISTPAFLLRKKVVDTITAHKWYGYKYGLPLAGDTLVTSLSDLFAAMTTFAGQAGANKWFRIRIASGGDWNSNANLSSSSWNFLPENGGGCVIVPNDPANPPLIRGAIYTGDQRGVQWGPGLVLCTTSQAFYATLRCDHIAGKPMSILRVVRNRIGFLHDPQYSETNFASYVASNYPQEGVWMVKGGEQLTVEGNDFWGTAGAVQAEYVRAYEVGWNRARRMTDDFNAVKLATATSLGSDAFTWASAGDVDSYIWVHDNLCHAEADNAGSYPYDAGNNWTAPHADFFQMRENAGSQGAWRVIEANLMLSSVQSYATNPGTNARDCTARQFVINSSDGTIHDVVIGNLAAGMLLRGIEVSNKGEACIEYNTLAGAHRMPPSGGASTFASIQQLSLFGGAISGVRRSRKNVTGSLTYCTTPNRLASEDDVLANFASGAGPAPGLSLAGPFYADSDSTGRIIYDVSDASTNTPSAERKSMWSALKPKGDAGAPFMAIRLLPGDTDTLTAAQAATLAAITAGQPSGTLPGTVSLRWNSGAGETGSQAGADVTLSVP